MPRKGSPYGPKHQAARLKVLGRPCALRLVCDGAPATEGDHVPPLSRHRHVEGSGCCRLQPACKACQQRQAADLSAETLRGRVVRVEVDEVLEPAGFGVGSSVWDVSWLRDLVVGMPAEAVWPRLMTVPHPRAVGSLGAEFERWVVSERGITLRWWQRLVARRLLEVDADGRLVWFVLLLTMARQLGKSWLVRMVLAWRLQQGARFGGPQLVLHMSIQMEQVRDVMGPEVAIAEASPDLYDKLDNNNATEIEWLADGSKWKRIVKGTARTGGAYGQSGVTVALVDEAWSIQPTVVDDGLEPTLVESEQPWLMLVSTAHRLSTGLMVARRSLALDELDTGVSSTLLVEWSTPRHFSLDDVGGWRLASPHWTAQRRAVIAGAVARAFAGVGADDPDEPDPVESVRSQWLNQWPPKLSVRGAGEPLLGPGLWASARVDGGPPLRLWVAVSDNFGRGAAVAAVAEIGGDRYELDGWLVADRDEGLVSARETLESLPVAGRLVVEQALGTAAPPGVDAAVPADVRFGLPLLRQLVESGRLVHDVTPELDAQLGECRVRAVSGGFALSGAGRSDLVRAAALAVRAAVVHVSTPGVL